MLALRQLRLRLLVVGVSRLVGKLPRVFLGLTLEADVELPALDAVAVVPGTDDLGLLRHAAFQISSAADGVEMISRATSCTDFLQDEAR
ncbi:MAG: hypothetical protein Athens041674_659 [Parcubacteria group bacterium Athens0416_74]|nr:MAG: hypothetical protein Athens041674_659 [Parcubacteria group bacterium Athens0416_74]